MPMPFDATMKELAEEDPVAFVSAFDAPPAGPVELLNVDLSTVTAAADVVFGVGKDEAGEPLEVIHIDAQSGPDADKGRDVLAYNALLHRRYRVPVHSILLLLRPRARHGGITGDVRYAARPGKSKMDFGYEVVPLWERPAEVFLTGALGLVPLATLAQLPPEVSEEEALAGIIRRIVERLEREATPGLRGKLATATVVLTGLRVKETTLCSLYEELAMIRESSAYDLFLSEGRLDEARKTLLRYAERHLGPAPEEVKAVLAKVKDIERLHRMTDLALEGKDWDEVLRAP